MKRYVGNYLKMSGMFCFSQDVKIIFFVNMVFERWQMESRECEKCKELRG